MKTQQTLRADAFSSLKLYPHYRRHYPAIIISDTHLGKKAASADMLAEFLQNIHCDTLILNGDIVDGWNLTSKRHKKFPEFHLRVLDAVNRKINEGTKVIYIAGNHDEKLRKADIFGKTVMGITFADSLLYQDRRNRRFFILHGDQFDPQILKEKGKVLYHVGDRLYDGLIELNAITGKAAHKLLKKRFSFAAYAKRKTKKMLGIIGSFEEAVADSTKHEDVDGIICGHIHHAEWRKIGKRLYGNSGDWVESCTALAMNEEGEWDIIHWLDEREKLGLHDKPSLEEPGPDLAFRRNSERMARLIQRIWPGSDRSDLLEQKRRTREEIDQRRRDLDRAKRDLLPY